MNFLKGYLILSSVILHLLLLLALIWAVPFFQNAEKSGRQMAEAMKEENIAVVEDVSELSKNEYKYNGYKINYNGRILYVTGAGEDAIKAGDRVNVVIAEHPYLPTKSLIVSIMKINDESLNKSPEKTQ